MRIAFTLDQAVRVAEALIALNATVRPEMGPRDHAAWVMNVLAHVVGRWIADAEDRGADLGGIRAAGLRLAAGIAAGGYIDFDLAVAPAAIRPGRAEAGAAAAALAQVFAPAVGALAFAGRLAPAALWRIAGDGLAAGWVQAGRPARAAAVLGAVGTPFANAQLRVAAGAVLRRGGCCRYLSVTGDPCANCPLRRPAG